MVRVLTQILHDALTIMQLPLRSTALVDLSSLSHVAVTCLVHFLVSLVSDAESVTSREVLGVVSQLSAPRLASPPTFDPACSFHAMDYFQQQVRVSSPPPPTYPLPSARTRGTWFRMCGVGQVWASLPPNGILPVPDIDRLRDYAALA